MGVKSSIKHEFFATYKKLKHQCFEALFNVVKVGLFCRFKATLLGGSNVVMGQGCVKKRGHSAKFENDPKTLISYLKKPSNFFG